MRENADSFIVSDTLLLLLFPVIHHNQILLLHYISEQQQRFGLSPFLIKSSLDLEKYKHCQ